MSYTVVKLEKIVKSFAQTPLLADVDLHIQSSDRMGIVGPNGEGKTTLLNIIVGSEQPDGGIVRHGIPAHARYYLTQSRHEIDHLQSRDFAEEFLVLSERLGLSESLFNSEESDFFKVLSGGERTKIALAMAFSSHAEMLVLDEPTNHLDANGIDWLISEANRYPGTLLAVSHDRFFLDQVVTRIVEVRNRRVQTFAGNYSFYAAERERQRQTQLRQFEATRKEQNRIENQIDELKQWAARGHQQAGKQGTLSERRQLGYKQYHRAKAKKLAQRVKSQINRLEKLRDECVTKPEPEKQVNFQLGSGIRHGNSLIEATVLSKSYGGRVLFRDSDFYVKQGDRIGIYGPNGCGKTTLLKMIRREESVSGGQLWVSPSMQVAYLTQTDESSSGETIWQTAKELPPGERTAFRILLANMGFTERHMQTSIAALSLGERTRLRLAELISHGHNLLLMDEPTNHLDVVSREELEKALRSYEGTIILVTHDRYLMDNVCDTLLVFTAGQIQRIETGLTTYLDSHRRSSESTAGNRMMVVETRIAGLMGDISNCSPGTEAYISLDSELAQLIAERKRLRSHLKR